MLAEKIEANAGDLLPGKILRTFIEHGGMAMFFLCARVAFSYSMV